MDEKEFGHKIAQNLNWGLSQIHEDKLAKLRAGRSNALASYREPIKILGLVTVSGNMLDVSTWVRKPLFWLPVLAIVAAISLYALNLSDDSVDDVGELDAKLLTGELPIDAFLDKDFGTWVKESSQQ
jgi:hypothetical protein